MRRFAAAVVLVGLVASSAWAQSSGIAVVDIEKVYDKCTKKVQLEQELKDSVEAVDKIIKDKDREITEARNEQKVLNPGSEQWFEKEQAIFDLAADLQLYVQLKRVELESRQVDMMRVVYRAIVDAVVAYAKEKNLALVVKSDAGELTPESLSELKLVIQTRQVLYANPALDITDAIIQRMNAQ